MRISVNERWDVNDPRVGSVIYWLEAWFLMRLRQRIVRLWTTFQSRKKIVRIRVLSEPIRVKFKGNVPQNRNLVGLSPPQ